MSRTVQSIPPPLGTNAGNTGSPNRVDTIPTTNDTINTTTTTNVAQNVVDENFPQLLDSRGGSHVTNVSDDNHQKDYKGKYKRLKAKINVLTKKIDAMSKGKSEKGLVAESFDWDEESVSSKDKGTTKIKAFMAIAE
ncbi:hypothetical protein Tco_0121850 [Tanacetum coccineum]